MTDQPSGPDSDDEEPRTIRAGRRRRSAPPGPEGRERADAPQRQRPDQPSGSPSTFGGSTPTAAGGSAGGLKLSPLMIIGIIVLLLIFGGTGLFSGGGGSGSSSAPAPAAQPDAGQGRPTLAPLPTRPPTSPASAGAPAAGGQKWLVMLYSDADDKILEQDIYTDLNEAERVGSGDSLQIVAQVDRYRGGFQGDGDWTSTKRFLVTKDDDLQRVGSQQIADLGETNMADGATLVDFVTWAVKSYPADKYVLILSDHGMGWPGGWSDPTARGSGATRIPLTEVLGDQLYLNEIDEALGQIRDQTGIDKFELLGMDACLMAHQEVFSALAPHARYAVASQETEPSLGWAYTSFLGALRANPAISGGDLGRLIVSSYIQDDQRIVDDRARADFAGRGSTLGALLGAAAAPPADQVRRELSRDITLTAADLDALPELNGAVNNLAFALQGVNGRTLAKARSYAQSFTNVFEPNAPAPYIDLGHFAQLVARESGSPEVSTAAEQVLTALSKVVVAEKHGPNKPGASGVSIYFPNSNLYGNAFAGAESYTVAARRFAEESLWDDLLAFLYTGQRFEQATGTVALPNRSQPITPPAAAPFEVSPLSLSATTAAPSTPTLLSAEISSGENVGYVKFMAGYYDQAANAIFIADSDYLESPTTKEVGGVFYPDWGAGRFKLEFEWEPIVMAINDGTTSAVALLKPESYEATPEQATYSVDGTYTFAEGGEQRFARLYFSDGKLRQVFGFTGENGAGSPREITPQPGDTFTILEEWLDLDDKGTVVRQSQQQGKTLTFGAQSLSWTELDAAAGDYVVGFIVEDLDGKPTAVYSQVTVR